MSAYDGEGPTGLRGAAAVCVIVAATPLVWGLAVAAVTWWPW